MNTETLDRLEGLLSAHAKLVDDVNYYSGNEQAGYAEIGRSAQALIEHIPELLSIARRAADVGAIRTVTAKASSEWPEPDPKEFLAGVAFVTKPHFVATAVSRYVMGETTPVSITDIGDDEEVK